MTTSAILWLERARAFLGLAEIPGKNTNPTIAGWLAKLKAPWRDDETAWCGTFVAAIFDSLGIRPVDGWASARNWLKFGVGIPAPVVGVVVVFWRGKKDGWSGHVGFVVGRDQAGNLMVLGGNQGDMVSIKPFGRDRVLGYRWPLKNPIPDWSKPLPLVTSDGRVSTDEA